MFSMMITGVLFIIINFSVQKYEKIQKEEEEEDYYSSLIF
jgi:hypothetical protein